MPRTARSIHAGLHYHVLNRGNNRATVFRGPHDFEYFLGLMVRAQARHPLGILAACLMPNHFHLVVKPAEPTDLSAWMHWLLTTHAARHHRERDSTGRIWTGRYKAFPIQHDRHLLTVVRYVERNPLRAGLVGRADEWLWGSLRWRLSAIPRLPMAPLPFPLPVNWTEFVNSSQTAQELAAVRRSVTRGSPFGDSSWVAQTAAELGLGHTLGQRGRRQRAVPADEDESEVTAPPN
jgi:putative transposase